ncbi:MAG: hypothetical protein HQK49_02280 [Oligoflexia bacterium]|nr:hypothetical protein [Oligoflexia bacterium]
MIYIFGAINIDIIAQKDKFLSKTSNIAKIDLNFGGVGFNIFKSLKTSQKKFITSIGNDFITPYLKKFLSTLNCSYFVNNNLTNGKYVAFMESGKLIYGAADVRVVEEGFSKKFISNQLKRVKSNDLVIVDANLYPSTVDFIVRNCLKKRLRVIFETVSVEKTSRSKNVLKNLFLITPTVEEMDALLPQKRVAGSLKENEKTRRNFSQEIINFMLKHKIENIILTKGEKGVEWFCKIDPQDSKDSKNSKNSNVKIKYFKPSKIIKTKDTTGAGDLLLASIVNGIASTSFNNLERSTIKAMKIVEKFLQRKK